MAAQVLHYILEVLAHKELSLFNIMCLLEEELVRKMVLSLPFSNNHNGFYK
jgi:hypothetical protein